MDIKSLFILNSFCLLILYFNPLVGGNSPFGFCSDPECSKPVSKGISVLRYHSPDDNKISMDVNEEVFIYVKEYGPKKDLFGVVAGGNRGYISKKFIRETQVLVKRLVPANVEFKSNILISDAVSSHLHVSSQPLQSGMFMNEAVPESHIHSQTTQQNFISMPPNSIQQNQGSLSPSSESSHSFPNMDPSSDMLYDSRFQQSLSQFNDIPMQPSQFHSGQFLSQHYSADVESRNIFPSPTPVPDIKHSSQFQSISGEHLPDSQFFGSSLNNIPNFEQQRNTLDLPQSEHFLPNSGFQSDYQQPNTQQQQQQQTQQQYFHSSNILEGHLSFQPQDRDEELDRTMSLLHDRGYDNTDMLYDNSRLDQGLSKSDAHLSTQDLDRSFDNTDIYGNVGSNEILSGFDVHPSSQNLESLGVGLSASELNGIPSQFQHQPMHSSDSPFVSSVNPSQPVEEINSHTHEVLQNNNDQPAEDVDSGDEKATVENVKENEDDEESDIVAEGEDEEEEEDNENLDLSETKNLNLVIKESDNTEMLLNLQSSMSATQNEQQMSEVHEDVKSSENSVGESNLVLASSIAEASAILDFTKSVIGEAADSVFNTISISLFGEKSSSNYEEKSSIISESISKNIPDDIPDRNNNDAFPADNIVQGNENTTPKINEFFVKTEQNSDLDKISGPVDIDGISESLTTYQVRNLKGEFETIEEHQSDSDGSNDENNTQSDSEAHDSIKNWLDSFRAFVDAIMSWIPEPLYSALMDLRNKDLSPRVPVFTALCGFICIFLIVPIICIKEWSKESRLTAQLANVEKDAYTLSATNSVLEEKLESVQSELAALQASLSEEKSASKNLQMGFENQEEELENAKAEIESCLQVIDSLKEKENEYLTTIQDQEKEIERYAEHKEALDKIMKDQENSISELTDQLQEGENKLKELEKEKLHFLQLKEDYEEKLAQFDKNCKQLLDEAEVWNSRVQDLTTNLEEERKMKQEFIETLKVKDEEIESLKELVEMFKLIDEIEDPEEQAKVKEEKLQSLMDSSMIVNQLKQEEEKSKVLDEQLTKEKNKILEMEVELLEAKSEIDKLKISYNQALQDKAEAQTKLDVLTNYFKDKEIQLQRQLGAQEAVRQKKEEDANSAERRICLIEQENASYKSQLASMKQEMEETERNLKSQIATQEKKAHENWIAARAAERKLEDMKQEVTQLRQRLTLLEREQENWANASRDEVIRPVPKRMPGMNDELGNQDLNTSDRGMFPPPLHDRLPPHMMLPPDRPLPPLPPPPMPPMFLPPMERHFRPQPWHMPPDHRTTPPEFIGGRESTPPRGRREAVVTDGDIGPHASSPLTTDTRDSRNSTPPHLLPDFHDVPPQPGRPFFPPPPLGHPRLPMHPPYRRDVGPGPKRLDPNEFNTRGSQQAPSQEQWQHSRV